MWIIRITSLLLIPLAYVLCLWLAAVSPTALHRLRDSPRGSFSNLQRNVCNQLFDVRAGNFRNSRLFERRVALLPLASVVISNAGESGGGNTVLFGVFLIQEHALRTKNADAPNAECGAHVACVPLLLLQTVESIPCFGEQVSE